MGGNDASEDNLSLCNRALLELWEELDGVALGEAHHGLLHLRALAGESADSTTAARRVHGAHTSDLDIKQLLHSGFDVWLGSSMVHLKGVLVHFQRPGGFFCDQRPADHVRKAPCE